MGELIHQLRMKLSTYRNYDPALFEADYIKEHIRQGRMFVTVGEREGPAVPLDQVVAKVVGISADEHGVNVSFIFLDTPLGNIARYWPPDLYKITPVGIGSLNYNGEVQADYRLSCFSLCPKQGDEDDVDRDTSGGVQGAPEEEPQPSPQAALADASEVEGTPDR